VRRRPSPSPSLSSESSEWEDEGYASWEEEEDLLLGLPTRRSRGHRRGRGLQDELRREEEGEDEEVSGFDYGVGSGGRKGGRRHATAFS
jgi:hypothetical protein